MRSVERRLQPDNGHLQSGAARRGAAPAARNRSPIILELAHSEFNRIVSQRVAHQSFYGPPKNPSLPVHQREVSSGYQAAERFHEKIR
jgi:hypothetical protein